MRGGRSVGAKNAPGVTIPKPKIGAKHGTAPRSPAKPEMYPQQLNPLSKKYGQPQYKDETPIKSKRVRQQIAHLKNS